MSGWVTCSRCRRRFGGSEALRLAHARGACRPAPELRARGLWRDEDGVWHRRGSATPGQMRLPLWKPGRPASKARAFSVRLLGGSWVRLEVVSRRPWRVRFGGLAA